MTALSYGVTPYCKQIDENGHLQKIAHEKRRSARTDMAKETYCINALRKYLLPNAARLGVG
jgi:hypothetical protein